MPWEDKKTWPMVWSLFASELSYTQTMNEIAALQAKTARTSEEESRLKHIKDSPDKDWDVMNNWITLLYDAGYDFFKDAKILEQRSVILNEIAGITSAKLVRVRERRRDEVAKELVTISLATTEDVERARALVDESKELMKASHTELNNFQQVVADLLARECIWFGD